MAVSSGSSLVLLETCFILTATALSTDTLIGLTRDLIAERQLDTLLFIDLPARISGSLLELSTAPAIHISQYNVSIIHWDEYKVRDTASMAAVIARDDCNEELDPLLTELEYMPLSFMVVLCQSFETVPNFAFDMNVEMYFLTAATASNKSLSADPYGITKLCPGQGQAEEHWDAACNTSPLGKNLTVSVIGMAPYIVYGENAITGSDIDLLNVAASKLGFSYHLKPETLWLEWVKGQWIGSCGSVHHKRAHLAVGHISVSIFSKLPGIEFSWPNYSLDIIIVSPKPKPVAPYFNMLKPFSWDLWLTILAALICTTLAYMMVRYLEGSYSSLFLDFLRIWRLLFAQSSPVIKGPFKSSNSILITWIICTVFLLASYECNLRAYLMAVDFEAPIDTDQDLVDTNRKLLIPLGTTFYGMYQGSPLASQRKLAAKVDEERDLFYFEQGLLPLHIENRMIAEGSGSLNGKKMALSQLPHIEKRHGYQPFRVGRQNVLYFTSAFALQKYLPWNQELKRILQLCVEAGLINHFARRYVAAKYLDTREARSMDNKPVPFQIAHIIGPMLIYSIGILIAVSVFAGEYLYT